LANLHHVLAKTVLEVLKQMFNRVGADSEDI